MKKKLLIAGTLIGLAIVMLPFMYFLNCVLSGDLRSSEIFSHGKYLVPSLLGGGLIMVFCIHGITGKKPRKKT